MKTRTIKRITGTDVIEVRYAGEIDYAFRLETLESLERILPPGGVHRLLINYTSAWPAPSSDPRDVAAFGKLLGRVAFAKGARVALVNAPSELGSQTDSTSASAGFLFRQFRERELAIAWLDEADGADITAT